LSVILLLRYDYIGKYTLFKKLYDVV